MSEQLAVQRAARATAGITGRGYRVVLEVACENADTPGFPGQIRGVTDHEARTVRVALAPLRSMGDLADTLEHEARHVEDPAWDCGNRDALGRGGRGVPSAGALPSPMDPARDERAHVATVTARAIQDASSARPESGHAVPSGMPSRRHSGRPGEPLAPVLAVQLSDPMQYELMRLARLASLRGPDAWCSTPLPTGQALERRGLAEVRAASGARWQARVTDRGLSWLADRGITCR